MLPSATVAVHGIGIDSDFLRQAVAGTSFGVRNHLDAVDGSNTASVAGLIVLFDRGEALPATHWRPPVRAWIEAQQGDPSQTTPRLSRALDFDLYANVTTGVVHDIGLARGMVTALDARCALSAEIRDDLEMAIHEAVSNALLHGNLQMPSLQGLSVEAIDRFGAEFSSKLADPAYAERRIEVTCTLQSRELVVDVIDQGAGFEVVPPSNLKASGRGLILIATVCLNYEILDGGRRIRMRFAL